MPSRWHKCKDCPRLCTGERCQSCYAANLRKTNARSGANNGRWKGESRKKLNRSETLPIGKRYICHFCRKQITKSGTTRDSLIRHHLDGNPSNNKASNVVPCHRKCHEQYHKVEARESNRTFKSDSHAIKRASA